MITTTTPATEKQQAFIERLLQERDLTGTAYAGWVPNWESDGATKDAASAVITYLLTLPKAEAPTADLEAGIYSWGGTLYRVYLGQQSGQMLVKKVRAEFTGTKCYCSDLQGVSCGVCRGDVERRHVDAVEYEYLGRAATHLPAQARRLALEEVGEIGLAWNHCIICGRRLDVPESVDRGIGPVCAEKY